MPPIAPVQRFATIDSTNAQAQRLAAGGTRGPLWLVADVQEAGKGRLGRNWVSPAGNLHVSYLVPVAAPVQAIPQIAFVTALAVHDTVSRFCGTARVRLKWPNDCLLAGGKVSGILCETVEGGQVVIGCGINIAHSPQGLAYITSRLHQYAPEASVDSVFATYAAALDARLAEWADGAGFADIIRAWEERAHGLHSPVHVESGNSVWDGVFDGLASDGALVVKCGDGSRQAIHAGDVTFRAGAA